MSPQILSLNHSIYCRIHFPTSAASLESSLLYPRLCFSTRSISVRSETGGIQISVKRLLNAGLSSRLPKSPPGFIVANSWNWSCATILDSSPSETPFSARTRLRPGSRTELRRSKTASSARLISSSKSIQPERIDSINGPSDHSNSALCLLFNASISLAILMTSWEVSSSENT